MEKNSIEKLNELKHDIERDIAQSTLPLAYFFLGKANTLKMKLTVVESKFHNSKGYQVACFYKPISLIKPYK